MDERPFTGVFPVWSEWRTVTREDGTTYEERECHHPGRASLFTGVSDNKTEDLYDGDGVPW
jgi:hypothetical protein